MSYLSLPLDVNEDYDVEAFDEDQLSQFYWDHPESIPD